MSSPTAAVLGEIGLPVPIRELAAKTWDVIVVGAGHNGLACAAYLAKAGKRVLVIESRMRVGGACTIEEPFPGVRMSPCAYLAGLLHPLVVEELELPRRGFEWTPAVNGLFVPFLDGSSIQLWDDDARCEAEVQRLAPDDVNGFNAMCDVIRRLRDALRPAGEDDLWIGEAPTKEQIELLLGDDVEARAVLFEWSMAEMVEHYLRDERLQVAYLGQGVIGTNASPFDPGTASIRFHHSSGRLGGMPGMWGYVKGGMGMVSFYFCDAAREAGATVVSGVPVAQILPGEGVVLEGGERIRREGSGVECGSAEDADHAGCGGGCGLEGARGGCADRGMHGEVECASERAAEFHSAAGNEPGAPLRADQCSADEGRSGRRGSRRLSEASCRSICGASCISRACTTHQWCRTARTR